MSALLIGETENQMKSTQMLVFEERGKLEFPESVLTTAPTMLMVVILDCVKQSFLSQVHQRCTKSFGACGATSPSMAFVCLSRFTFTSYALMWKKTTATGYCYIWQAYNTLYNVLQGDIHETSNSCCKHGTCNSYQHIKLHCLNWPRQYTLFRNGHHFIILFFACM